MNDIALLKLGKETHYLLKDIRDERLSFKELESTSLIAEERVDLSKYPPACLPQKDEDIAVGTKAFVYGG